jgi:RNA polymerase sigma-70 factor (ECF subfamily)
LPAEGDPAALASARETVQLAFVAALHHLPPRQRAVLLLREVLDWQASEVAELLGTSVPAVNSAMQRARATLAARQPAVTSPAPALEEQQRALLARYVTAFEQYDLDALTALLREDATWSMPPYRMWLRGHRDIRAFCLGPGIACRDSVLVPVEANGAPAYGQYKPEPGGGYTPWALQVLELAEGRIAGVCFFLDTARLFPLFALPPRLESHDLGKTHEGEQIC